MKRILLLSFFLFGAILSHADSLSLRSDLEACYRNYSNAINHYELDKIKLYMSEHRYRHVRNQVTSQKLNFPDDFISEACFELVNLKKAKFLFVEENGNTANCSYHGKGVYHHKALIIINFVKEDSTWKYDGITETSFHGVKSLEEPKVLDSLKMVCTPNGVVPAMEPEIDSVQYRGWFNMHAQGYLVYIKINGVKQDIFNDIFRDGVVLGGLKLGKNTIDVELIPIANVDKRDIRISVRGFISEAERDVFHLYELEGETNIHKEFEIKEYPNIHPNIH